MSILSIFYISGKTKNSLIGISTYSKSGRNDVFFPFPKPMKYIPLFLVVLFCACRKGYELPESKIHFTVPIFAVTVGNSLTMPYGLVDSANMYPAQLPHFINAEVFNAGVAGLTTTDMLKPQYYNLVPSPKKGYRNIMIVWEISNDIYAYGFLGSRERFKLYCDKRKAEGWEIFVMTVVYRDTYLYGQYWINTGHNVWAGYPDKNPSGEPIANWWDEVDSANAFLKQTYGDHLTQLPFASYDTTYFFPDHTHLKPAALTIVAKENANTIFECLQKEKRAEYFN